MKNEVLGNYIISAGKLTPDQQNMLAQSLALFAAMGGLEGSVKAAVSCEVPMEMFENEAHAMYTFIKENNGEKDLNKSNTAVLWHDTSLPDAGVWCCLIISGKYKDYQDCDTVFGPYYGSTVSREEWSQLSEECRALMKQAAAYERKGDLKQAIYYYGTAYSKDRSSFVMGRKLCRVMLQSDDQSERETVFKIISQLARLNGNKAMTGPDYALLARSLYVYVENGSEGELDRLLKPKGYTTRKYLERAISDARFMGTDIPEFKEMLKSTKKGFGGLFSKR